MLRSSETINRVRGDKNVSFSAQLWVYNPPRSKDVSHSDSTVIGRSLTIAPIRIDSQEESERSWQRLFARSSVWCSFWLDSVASLSPTCWGRTSTQLTTWSTLSQAPSPCTSASPDPPARQKASVSSSVLFTCCSAWLDGSWEPVRCTCSTWEAF